MVTNDGYILKLFRCWSNKFPIASEREPVMIVHALLDTSDTWVLNPPNQALGKHRLFVDSRHLI